MATKNKVPFVVNFRKDENLNSSGYGYYYAVAEQKPTSRISSAINALE